MYSEDNVEGEMLPMVVTKSMLPSVVTIYALFIVTAKGNKVFLKEICYHGW